MSYLERTVVGLSPDGREDVREYIREIGKVAVERADTAAPTVDRRLAELDNRRVDQQPEPVLASNWIALWLELLLEIRDREPPYQDDVRDWCNGVLTLLDDMRRHAVMAHQPREAD